MTMYDILAEQMEAINELVENGGELTPELQEALAVNKENFQEKMDAYVHVIKNYKALVDAISEEKKKLDAKKKAAENTIERLKGVMMNAMEVFDMPKAQVGIYKLSIKETDAVNVLDEDAIPEEYKKVKVEVSKTDIKNAFKEGVEVPGAEIVKNKSLMIK